MHHHPTGGEDRSSSTPAQVYQRLISSPVVTDSKLLQELAAAEPSFLKLAPLKSTHWLIHLIVQSLAFSYSIHCLSAHSIAFSTSAILSIQSVISLFNPTQTQLLLPPTNSFTGAVLLLLDHFFLFCSISHLSALSLILLTTCSSEWSPSISQLLTQPWRKSSQLTPGLTCSALVALCMLAGCLAVDLYVGADSDAASLMVGYFSLSAHLVCRGVQASSPRTEQKGMHHQRTIFTATGLSLILSLASLLLPSSQSQITPTTPEHLQSWVAALIIYSTVHHLSLTEASKSSRDSNPSSSTDVLSLIIVRMLSCELAGTLAFDQPMANISHRLVALVSYLGISSMTPSSAGYKSYADTPQQQVMPLRKMSQFIKRARSVINTILVNPESRNIYFFLCLNLAFMLVQMTYGIWTNSLGLISDSIHMFFDCMALGMGLFASVMATWPADKQFTYGYGRVETLSGFANGVFLMLISTFIVFEAVQRLIDPPEMNTNQLLAVSFIGLLVNLVGMFATGHHHHHHGHGHSHDHDHDHGHSHNMKGVFLHVMADTLGSVGVIISTLLIERYGWTGFDPIASIFIAVLIFASVVPLVQDSAKILMLCLDDEQETQVRKALGKLSTIEGLSSYSAPRFWPQDSSTISGSLHLQISPLPSQPESTTTSVALGSPVMMLDEHEELFSFYGHAELVKKRVEKSLATSIPSLAELTLQVEGIDGSKNCFCLTGPNL
ncbi:hypothetical protein PCASD_01497 [Puccinia coronata f. sp. avenae]|uniref:Cation efflux protein transmembrane domain-containing protein n=1 Tax=Puccinia coronata f. sp. avenae TaxID=200324 RepID=A0A2N5VKP7_9BASI|nr:hypothetical protein PCASD_01497 [Puccinia coronata f. sp. avenae]